MQELILKVFIPGTSIKCLRGTKLSIESTSDGLTVASPLEKALVHNREDKNANNKSFILNRFLSDVEQRNNEKEASLKLATTYFSCNATFCFESSC